MVLASETKEGMTLHLDGKFFRVLEVVRHAGSGQMHGFIEVKLKDIRFGHFADRRFKQSERLETVDLARRHMGFLYADTDSCYFMDPKTFEQVSIPKSAVGTVEHFLKEGMQCTVELLDGEAVSLQFPKVVELTVASTGTGIRGGQDNTMKPAILENGVELLVPQFVEAGEVVRVDTERVRYVDRVPLRHL